MMKKAIAILLSLVMILGLAACENSASQTEQPSTEKTSVESKTDTESSETNTENTANPDVQEHKILVACFSATGTTKGAAEHIANGLNADIYEIVPEEPYTDADLDYNDNNSRTTIEMNIRMPVLLSPAVWRIWNNMILYSSDTLSGGEKRRELSALSWRAMTFPVKPLYLSVHPEEVVWAPVQPTWNSLQPEHSGFLVNA